MKSDAIVLIVVLIVLALVLLGPVWLLAAALR